MTPFAPFDRSLAFTLKWEGGFVNHPADPGGATNKGVTQDTYDAFRGARGLPFRSVGLLTDDELSHLYRERFWLTSHANEMPLPLCSVHFDAAVNSGPGRAIRLVQEAAGVTSDGVWGPKTRRAVLGSDPVALARDAVSRRRAFLLSLIERRPALGTFKSGWLNRLAGLESLIDEWVADHSPRKVGS